MSEHTATNGELPDRRRVSPDDKRPVSFVLMDPSFRPNFDMVTSVAAVAFNDAGDLVVAFEHGGPDFPGGHIRIDETTFEQTLQRESLEEAGIVLAHIQFVRAIQAVPEGSAETERTYMVMMTGIVSEYREVPAGAQRNILTAEKFRSQYRGLDSAMVATLVDEAHRLVFGQ